MAQEWALSFKKSSQDSDAYLYARLSVCVELPGEGAATAKPFIFYVSAQHVLSSAQ